MENEGQNTGNEQGRPPPPVEHQFQPGESGNPAGRPKGAKNRSTVLREIYEMVIEGKDLTDAKKEMTVEQAVMHSLIKKAIAGDVPAIKEAQDTLYGKVPDKLANTDSEGNDAPRETIVIRERRPKDKSDGGN
jgi:hypothetical protein